MKSPHIPEGWVYVTSDPDSESAWRTAVAHKQTRERLRPDLFVRVKVAPACDVYWILRRDEPRRKHVDHGD